MISWMRSPSVGRKSLSSLLGIHVALSFCVAIAAAQTLDHDSSLPIQISANSLEVEQEEQIATFAGDVDAVQGDLVLSADTLRVHYEGKGSAIGLAAGSGNAIRQIDAEGHVVISSPDETAEGDHGTYDVPAKLVTLEGQVVLTRGANVIRGERLELDLVTGKSRMVGAETSIAGGDQKTSTGRVKALFTPKTNEDETSRTARPKAEAK